MVERVLGLISNWLWPRQIINIKLGQSIVIIGRPGTGKSTLLRWLLKSAESVIVYDSKYDPEEWPTQSSYKIVDKPSELGNHSRVVLRCKAEWLHDKESWNILNHPWAMALEHPMQRGRSIAVFDEALATWPVQGGHPGTHRLIQQGRSFYVTVIVGSQLANNVDTRLLRMANHIFVLGPSRHATELSSLFNANQIEPSSILRLRKHEAAWWSDNRDHWTLFRRGWAKRESILWQRKVKLKDQPRITIKGYIFYVLLFGLSLLVYLVGGWAPTTLLIGFLIARGLQARRWKLKIESGEWVPGETNQEPPIDNIAQKRSAKSFRIG